MNTQQQILQYLDSVRNLIKGTDINYSKEIDRLIKKVKEQQLIVPVVGGFSAGKSTLINSFLGINVLPTNISPETALATELHYNFGENYIKAYKNDSDFDIYNVDQMEIVKEKAKEYKFLKLYLNNENLKNIKSLILVDMPGFDSPIKQHNDAIINYLDKAAHFVFLTSIEDGTISKSMEREINNLFNFGKDFSFGISKVDLKPESDIFNVKEVIQEQLYNYFDFNKDIILFDNNSGLNLEKILVELDVDSLFKKVLMDDLLTNESKIIDIIKTKVLTYQSSQEDSQIIIDTLKESINEIKSQEERALKNLDINNENDIQIIINKVISDLTLQVDYLASVASNSLLFTNEINSIIRTSLTTHLKERLMKISKALVDNIKLDLESSFAPLNIPSDFLEQLSEQVDDSEFSLVSLSDAFRTMLKAVTKILSMFGPIVTKIVNVMSDILLQLISKDLFDTGYDKNSALNKKVIMLITNKIIPKLKVELTSQVKLIYNKETEKLVKNISQQVESRINEKTQVIQNSLDKKQSELKNLDFEISKLEETINQLKLLHTTYLN